MHVADIDQQCSLGETCQVFESMAHVALLLCSECACALHPKTRLVQDDARPQVRLHQHEHLRSPVDFGIGGRADVTAQFCRAALNLDLPSHLRQVLVQNRAADIGNLGRLLAHGTSSFLNDWCRLSWGSGTDSQG